MMHHRPLPYVLRQLAAWAVVWALAMAATAALVWAMGDGVVR